MSDVNAFDSWLAEQLKNPEFRKHYEAARAELAAKALPVPQEPSSCCGGGEGGGCCSSNAPEGAGCAGKCGGKP